VNPYVFTEQGVAMLSAVLRSDIAIQVSIQIINAFVTMRKTLAHNQGLIQRIDSIEKKQLETDQKFEEVFKAMESGSTIPDQLNYQIARKYWNKLKERLKKDGNETVTNCHQLKMLAKDGKIRKIQVANTEGLFRIIQSIPSPKAELIKLWLA